MESKAEMVDLMDKIPGSFKSILNAEVSPVYSVVLLFINNLFQAKMLLEERIRENKINILSKNNNNNNNNNNNSINNNNNIGVSESVPVAAGEAVKPLNSKFKLKNIIQAKVEFDSAV